MAIAFDSVTASSIVNPGTSLTFSHTCTGSDLILVVGTLIRTNTVTGVTYNGTACTAVGTRVLNGSDYMQYWILVNPDTGANDVVITGNTSGIIFGGSTSYTGAKQSGQEDANISNDKTTETTTTTTLTTVADNCWTVMIARCASSGTSSAGTGTTQRDAGAGHFQTYDSNGAITPAGSTSLQSTQTSQPVTHQMMSIAPAPSGPVIKTMNTVAKANIATINTVS